MKSLKIAKMNAEGIMKAAILFYIYLYNNSINSYI